MTMCDHSTPARSRVSNCRAGSGAVSASTFCRTPAIASSFAMLVSTSAISEPTSRISASPNPRVVTAGEPRRIPLGFIGGLVSNGIAFLLTVMRARSSACSASLPRSPLEKTSSSTTCVSVPPETTRKPASISACAMARALATTCFWYATNSGCMASRKQTALAASTCTSGPPCVPGKTFLSISLPYFSRARIMPARGPRSVLCVVVVTMSACSQGLGWTPAATRPEMCAMSTRNTAPTRSAIWRKRAKSMIRG